MAASNRSTAFQQNSESHCKTADEERVRERRGVGGVVRGVEEDDTGGVEGAGGEAEGEGPGKTDATTVAMALWDINSPRPHCANLIGALSCCVSVTR